MLHLDDMLATISNRGRRLGLKATCHGSHEVVFENGPARVYVEPVMHANEIETRLRLGKEHRQDAIQEWLGYPIQAYMFREETFDHAVRDVVKTVALMLARIDEDPKQAALELEAAEDRLSDRARRDWLRTEADEAWKAGRDADVIKLYSELEPHLSDAEAKRLKLSRRRSYFRGHNT